MLLKHREKSLLLFFHLPKIVQERDTAGRNSWAHLKVKYNRQVTFLNCQLWCAFTSILQIRPYSESLNVEGSIECCPWSSRNLNFQRDIQIFFFFLSITLNVSKQKVQDGGGRKKVSETWSEMTILFQNNRENISFKKRKYNHISNPSKCYACGKI